MCMYSITLLFATLHISRGNAKTGIGVYTFNTLPGNSEHLLYVKEKGLLTDIPGTCSKYCTECAKDGCCYAWRDGKRHHNHCIKAWGENTLLLRNDPIRLFALINDYITKKNARYNLTKNERWYRIQYWRWHSSGEIETLLQLELMNETAEKHPEVQFGVYTKNFDVLEQYIKKHGIHGFAKNFAINVSQWHGVADNFLAKYPGVFNVFTYDDSHSAKCTLSEKEKKRLASLPHCPAVNPDGSRRIGSDGKPVTCTKCHECYKRHCIERAVYSH